MDKELSKKIGKIKKEYYKEKAINKIFSWFNVKKHSCSFINNGGMIQRTKQEYDRLIDCIIYAVEKHEPWILKEYEGRLTPDKVRGYSLLGRYLDDSCSPLYRWWGVQGKICPICYREYGQMFYTLHCSHGGS